MKKKIITLAVMTTLFLGLVACSKGEDEAPLFTNSTGNSSGQADYDEQQTEESANKLIDAQVGDIITFGHYEQDNDLSNGAEEIEWRVLSAEITPNGLYKNLYVISKYVIESQPYYKEYASTYNRSSDLGKWLNATFLSTAFTLDEQELISDSHPSHSGITKVGLLTQAQLEEYFENGDEAMTDATKYALEQAEMFGDEAVLSGGTRLKWWLADKGQYGQKCMLNGRGFKLNSPYHIDDDSETRWLGVRPTIVIRIEIE